MIPDLLWRCPLCAANDALLHRSRRFRPDTVICSSCGAYWRVRRAVGDDFYLKLMRGGRSGSSASDLPQPRVGEERRLAAWYDLMKQSFRLQPIAHAHLSTLLDECEALYLVSGAAELWGEPLQSKMGGTAEAVCLGKGRLILTNQRFMWQGDDQSMDWPLRQVNGVYAFVNFNLAMVVGQRLYQVLFARDSLLKWVTYAARLASQVQAESGHLLRTSHY